MEGAWDLIGALFLTVVAVTVLFAITPGPRVRADLWSAYDGTDEEAPQERRDLEISRRGHATASPPRPA